MFLRKTKTGGQGTATRVSAGSERLFPSFPRAHHRFQSGSASYAGVYTICSCGMQAAMACFDRIGTTSLRLLRGTIASSVITCTDSEKRRLRLKDNASRATRMRRHFSCTLALRQPTLSVCDVRANEVPGTIDGRGEREFRSPRAGNPGCPGASGKKREYRCGR